MEMMTHRLPVTDVSGVAAARRETVRLATAQGFDETDAGRVAIVVTELGNNLCRHGKGGELLVNAGDDEGALMLLALDRGPGMADIATCLRDGYSTAGTPGTGLGAARRQADAFDIWSAPGAGTAVLARFRRRRTAAPPPPRMAAISVPKPGETVCGDSWDVAEDARGAALLVADGLGHGPLAAEAAREARRLFRAARNGADAASPAATLSRIHAGLRHTRGAAVAAAHIEPGSGQVLYSGIGNIAGTLLCAGQSKRMVSHNGTAGQIASRVQDFTYPCAAPVIVMHSDGLSASWPPERYLPLAGRDPALLAGLLYRDHARGRDDATVLVWKAAA
jgi:anti-sigma regulatory factor (Ser/Thr protein kinase)